MSLTITIPGAVNVTAGSMAPAVLTIGVGVPGAAGPQGPAGPGVPAGGTAGQFLTKINGTDYNTDWTTLNLSAYLTKAGNLSGLTDLFAARDNLQLGALYTPTFAGVTAQGSGSNVANLTPTSLTLNQTGYGYFTIQPSQGIRFPDTSVQTTAFPAGSNVPTGGTTGQSLVKSSNSNYAVTWSTIAGQPTSGTVGQVLMKNSGADYDSSWSTLIPGDRYLTSSTTSNTIGNGTKTFTVGTGLSYSSQQDVVISFNASNHMHALVTSYNSGTGVLVVDVQHHTGAGTYTSWTVNVGGTTPLQTVEWGEILGVLGDQTDLATALNGKLNTSTAASTYAPLAGATFTGEIFTAASTTSNAGLTITPGVAPSAPVNGELWTTSTDLQVRLNGVTETVAEQSWVTANFYPLTGNPSGFLTSASLSGYALLSGATFTGLVTTLAPTTTTAGLNLPHGTAPTTPVNGDLWTTTGGLFWRQNGGTKQAMNLGDTQTVGGNITFSNASLTLGNSTAASTYNLGTGATLNATTKAINIGTAGVSGSTTNITIGSAVSGALGTTTVNGNITATGTTLTLGNSTAASTINVGTGATLSGSTKTINIGTNGVLGSTNVINIGPTATSGNINFNNNSVALGSNSTATTAAADTNSTALATTAYVVGQAGSATPLVDGTAAVGTSLRYARQDHVHPTDTSRAALASPTFTGTPAAPTAAVDTNTTQLATTAFVVAQAAAATPIVDGTAAVGTSLRYARQDHVHPTDTTRAPLASPTFTGTVTIPAGASISGFAPLASPTFTGTPSLPTGTTAVTQSAGNNTTAVATTAFVTAATLGIDSPMLFETCMEGVTPALSNTSMTAVAQRANSNIWNLLNYGSAVASGSIMHWFSPFDGQWYGQNGWNFSKAGNAVFYANVGLAAGATQNADVRIFWGRRSTDAVGTNIGIKGFQIRFSTAGGTMTTNFGVHNGTTLTEVSMGNTTAAGFNKYIVTWDGSGNFTCFRNGVQVATSSAGPTGTVSDGNGVYAGIDYKANTGNTAFHTVSFLNSFTMRGAF